MRLVIKNRTEPMASADLASLKPLFHPRSVAVIGASRRRGTIGGELFHNIITGGFTGVVYPVNSQAESVQAVRAYPSITEVPDKVDLAVVAVPAVAVPEVIDQCIEKGVKALVVISAGFKEIGAAGQQVEDALTARIRQHGVRMVGPNCLGFITSDPEIRLNASFSPVDCAPGPIAFMSQSGALGVAILDATRELGLGLSSFVSVGNKADVSANDLLEYWETDPRTEVILLYLESFGNPRKFTRIARRVSRKKPIAVVKSGRTASGRRAASSHTGALAGVDVAVDALFRQAGVIRTNTIEELFNTAMILVNEPLPKGRRLAVVTNAGGPGILAVDAAEQHGLELPDLSETTVGALKKILPPEASPRNPVDMIASASAEVFRQCIEIILADPAVDMLLVIFVPPLVTSPDEVADAITAACAGSDKLVVSCIMGTHGVLTSRQSLRARSIPSFAFPEAATVALSKVATYADWRRRPEGETVEFKDVQPELARSLMAPSLQKAKTEGLLLPTETCRELLVAYGIPAAAMGFAKGADEAAELAQKIGFPVAVKLASDTLSHKSDVGGIRLNLPNASAVRDATFAIEGHLRTLGMADRMQGVHVQQMVPSGAEVIIGMSTDPVFGPLMMFGLGGTYVELLKDVSFRLHPLTDRDVDEMIRDIRSYKLLEGYRNEPAADIDAIKEVLLRLNQMISDFPEICEMDINPLKVMPPGKGCMAVDIRMRVCASNV